MKYKIAFLRSYLITFIPLRWSIQYKNLRVRHLKWPMFNNNIGKMKVGFSSFFKVMHPISDKPFKYFFAFYSKLREI